MKRQLTVLLIVLFVLAACARAGSPDAGASASVKAAASVASAEEPSPTSAYTLPPRPHVPKPSFTPSGDREKDLDAFGRYALKVYSYTMATRDLSLWNALSAPECTFCNNTRKEVENGEAGQWSQVDFTVKKQKTFRAYQRENVYRLDYLVDRSEYTEYRATSGDTTKPATHALALGVLEAGENLRLISWEIAKPEAFGSSLK
ncbi:thioredoxin-related protein [Arcanobacterium wilhelmae]|uniref:Thioredoxin-related protein n=1 Tax=Arcanobacterium wilhelmae TaxID=1803177 RepID=A0ABT9N9N8_9ACTO|nr:hypothetical protein [Arcanobacterium wilhelmae]MDP9800220.1 thioredoxin-related protein [Arcanobacterium wilhelmae]WFN89659.1 hypothetical protein P8A24_05480 [Arcanobacterium wilhelmae]